jgi:hypothetical protein
MLRLIASFVFCSVRFGSTQIDFAAPKEWSEREAIAEAKHDIRARHVKFYYWGGYAPQPVGVPPERLEVALRYPKAMAGEGCVVVDRALNERQRIYAETYNTRILTYLRKH